MKNNPTIWQEKDGQWVYCNEHDAKGVIYIAMTFHNYVPKFTFLDRIKDMVRVHRL